MMARCIRLDRDCSQVCRLAASLMASGSEWAAAFCGICAVDLGGVSRPCASPAAGC